MNTITVGQLINNNATDKDFKPFPNLDFKYGPYSSIAEALSNIPVELRAVGLTVGIRVNSTIQEFWFNGGVRDADLVVKNNGSGGGNGEAGTVPNWKTFVFKQSATRPDPPTEEDITPAGWSGVPTVAGIWWMSVGEVRGATGKVTNWSIPIKCTGEDGVAGKYYNFKYAVNTSPSNAPTINRNADDPGSEWSDIVPAINKGQYLWMTIGMFNDGKLEGQWSAPIRINAEDGQSGVGVRVMYQKTIDYVNAPPFDEDNINPGSAWSTTIPSGSGAVWGIFAQINIDGTLASNWVGPILMSGKPGVDGTDGTDGTVPNWKTYIYAKSTTIPIKPTSQELIPAGWNDSPDSNDGQWWQCIGTVNGSSNKVVSWSNVIPVNGRDGDAQDGKHTEFRFASSPSATEHPSITRSDRNPGAAWTVEFPTLTTSSPYMWMTKATILPSDAIEGYWEDPVCITGEAGKKGDTGPAGKDGVNGSNGIDGVPGISIEARYSLGSDTAPSAAFDSTIAKQRNPDGWSLTIPVPTQEKLYIWCIQTRISYNSNSDKLGRLELDWSTPFKLTGTNGLPGSNGHNQIIYPQGIYDSTKSYVSDEYKAPYVYNPTDGNFYVLNYEGPWKGTDQVYSTPSESYDNKQRYWIRFEGYEAIYTKIGIIANGLIGSAVFNGNYMFSQQGVDANGLKTTAYENFNPDNPGAPLNGKTFVPATLLDLKEGDAWFGHGNMNIDSQGNVAINGYIKERFDYFNGGVDEFSDIMIQSTRQVMIASDTNYTTKFAVGYSSGHIIMPTQFKLDLNVPVNIKFINLSNFMWNLVLDDRKSGLFFVNYWEEYGDMDQAYTFPKVFLHGGRVLDLIFLPTTTKTETIGSIVTTYYHGNWHVINTNEFVMKRGTAGDYSDYILESKNLEYK